MLLERRPGKLTFEEECEEDVASSGSPPEISSKMVFEVKVPLFKPLKRRRVSLPPERLLES